MIDERQEELASLYALDLLEGAARAQFEAALARDPSLQALVRELRDSSAALAHTAAPAELPPELKARVLGSIATRPASAPAPAAAKRDARDDGKVVRPAFGFWQFVPWAAAAALAVTAGWFAYQNTISTTTAAFLREQHALAELALKSARNQLEAERLVTQREVADLGARVAESTRQLNDTQQKSVTTLRELADAQQKLATTTRQLADAQERLVAVDRALAESRTRIAELTRDMKAQGDLANLKITTLASMLDNSPKALAVALWDPARQEGVLKVENLPALAANEDYQLWVVDPQYPNPVDGGVFTVEPGSGARQVTFKAKQPVSAIAAFAVTRERKGGVPKAEGPFVLLGKSTQ